jgi:cell volume regulation protein A
MNGLYLLQINTTSVLVAVGLIIILGYVAEALFRRTKIPDVLLLMLIGLIIVPVAHLLPDQYLLTLRGLLPIFGTIALIVIMYQGAKQISIASGKLKSRKGLLLAILDGVLAIAIVTPLMYYLFGWPPIYGALLGSVVASTGAVVVLSIINKLSLPHDIYETLLVEATFNSVVSILFFTIILNFATGTAFTLPGFVTYAIDYLSVAVFIGVAAGIAWLFVMSALRIASDYLITIAVAILLYGVVDFFNGAGIVSILVFSIIIANYKLIGKYLRINISVNEKETIFVERNFAFLIKTFFFVFLGMVAAISVDYLALGVLITTLLLLARYIQARLVLGSQNKYLDIVFAMFPRDTTSAVLAGLLYAIGGMYFNYIFYVTFVVIVLTNILTSIFTSRIKAQVKPVPYNALSH